MCVVVHSHVCAPARLSLPLQGKGSSPQAVPSGTTARPGLRGHGCLMQRPPELHPRQGGERGERGAEPRPDIATVSGSVGCLFPTLLNRLRHLVCCVRLSLYLFPFSRVSRGPCRGRMQEASRTSAACPRLFAQPILRNLHPVCSPWIGSSVRTVHVGSRAKCVHASTCLLSITLKST